MKKLVTFSLGLLLLSGCSFQTEEEIKWEYKEVKKAGKKQEILLDDSDYSSRNFSNSTSILNELGKEGWELVTVYPLTETVFPNFGNKGYHTGIKENTRTEEIVFVFKRKVKIEREKIRKEV